MERKSRSRTTQICANIVVLNAFATTPPQTNYEAICDSCVFQKYKSYENTRCGIGLNSSKAIKNYSCTGYESNRMYPNIPPSDE